MDPSTSQHRQDTVAPTAVVTKKDSERWAKVLAHLHKVGHQDISFAHMTLLEEVHYTRNPAGGGWKAASWMFKMWGGAVYATADEAAAFMRHKLQDPAVRAAATAEAATVAAQHSAAAGAHAASTAGGLAPSTSIRVPQHASVAARQGVRPVAMPCELPPAKKQRPAQQDGAVAAAVAASAVQQRPAGMQQNRAGAGMRASCSTAGAAAASQGAGKSQQHSGVASHASLRPLQHQDSDLSSQCGLASRFILEASGALVRCFPHTAGPGSRASTVTPGASCSSRVFVTAVSGRSQSKPQQQLVQQMPLQQQQQQQQGGVGTSSDEECSLADMARAWQAQQQQQEFQPPRPQFQQQCLPQQRQEQWRQQQALPQQHGAAGGGDLPPCARLVYDTRRRNKELDLHTALEITAAQYMEWLAATGAQDVPGDGEELASCLLDGEDPIVQLKGITPAVFTELRGVLPANFAPIVQGHRRPEPSDVDAADQPPPLQQQQQVKAAAAAGAAAAAASRKARWEDSRQHRRDRDSTYDGADDSPSKSSGGHTDRSSGSEATDPGMDCEGSPADQALSLPAYLRAPSAAQHAAAHAVEVTPMCAAPARQTSFSSTSSVCMAAPAAASARKPAAAAQHASRLGLTSGPHTGSNRAAGAAMAAAGGDGAADAHLGARCGPLTDSSRIAGAAGPASGDVLVDASKSARQRLMPVGFPSELHTQSSTVAGAAGAVAAALAAEEVAMAAPSAGQQVHNGIQCGPNTHSSMAAGAAGVAAVGGVAAAAAATPGLQQQVGVQCGPYSHNNMAAGGAGAAAGGDVAVAAAAAGLQVHIGVPYGPLKAEAGPGSNSTTPTWSEADTTERHHFADAYSRHVQQQMPGPAFGSGLKRRDPRAKLLGAAAAGVLQPPPPALLVGPLAAGGAAAAAAGPVEVLPSPAVMATPAAVPAPVPPTQQFDGPGEELGSAGGRAMAEGQVSGPAEGMYRGEVGGPGGMFGTDGDVGQAGGPGAGLSGPNTDMGQVGGSRAGLPGPDTDMRHIDGPVAGLPGSGGESGEAGGPAAAGGGVAAPAAGTSGDAAAAPVGATGVASGAAAASGGAAAWGGAAAPAAAPAGAVAAAAPPGAAQGPTGAAAGPLSINDPVIQQAMAATRAETERLRQERDAAMEMCLQYQEEIRMSRAVFGLLSVPVVGMEAGEGAGNAGRGGDGDGAGNMQE